MRKEERGREGRRGGGNRGRRNREKRTNVFALVSKKIRPNGRRKGGEERGKFAKRERQNTTQHNTTQTILLSKSRSLLIRHISLLIQITLISNQHNHSIGGRKCLCVSQPRSQMIKGRTSRDIIHKKSPSSSSVVAPCHSAEPFLSSSIPVHTQRSAILHQKEKGGKKERKREGRENTPNLKLNFFTHHLNHTSSKLHSNCVRGIRDNCCSWLSTKKNKNKNKRQPQGFFFFFEEGEKEKKKRKARTSLAKDEEKKKKGKLGRNNKEGKREKKMKNIHFPSVKLWRRQDFPDPMSPIIMYLKMYSYGNVLAILLFFQNQKVGWDGLQKNKKTKKTKKNELFAAIFSDFSFR